MRKKLFSLFLLIFASFVLVACNDDKVNLEEVQADTYEAIFQGEDTIDSVTQNMVFKTTSDKHKDVTIVWTSDNTAVVTNTGVVTRQSEDKKVKISFEITYKKETLPKEFEVTVKKTDTPTLEEKFSITLPEGVTASQSTDIVKNTEVTLTVNPPVGKLLSALVVDGEDVTDKVTNNTYKFKVTSNVVVTVTFKNEPNPDDRFRITLPDNVSATQETDIISGTEVTLTIYPDEGEVLESLKLNGKDFTNAVLNNEYTFVVTENVNVTVSFKQIEDEDVLDLVAKHLKSLYHEEYEFSSNELIELLELHLEANITWDLGVHAKDGKWLVTKNTTVTVDATIEYKGKSESISLTFKVKFIAPQEGEEQVLFETGFEENEGFIPNKKGDSIIYNDLEYLTGSKDNEFIFSFGTPSQGNKISGEQSAQIRYYGKSSPGNFGYIQNDFEIDNFSKVTFSAKSTDDVYDVKVEMSNTGENWYRPEVFTISKDEVTEITYINTRDYYKFFRISIVVREGKENSNGAGIVVDDLKVYGFREKVETATVTLDHGYNENIETEDVTIGEAFAKPNDPVRAGFTFKHWVLKGTDTAYDFSKVITEDIYLVAVWEKETYTVTLESEGITVSKDEDINYNETITITINAPEGEVLDVLTVNGKDLTEGVVDNKLEFTVTSDVTISATFKQDYGSDVIEEVANHLKSIYPEGYVFSSNIAIDLLESHLEATITWNLGEFAKDGKWVVTKDTQATIDAVIAFEDVEVKVSFSIVIRFIDPTFTEQLIYETGFESIDGFKADTTYNNQVEKVLGNEDNQFGILSGTISTNQFISGKQSAQIRYYLSTKNTYGYLVNKFELVNFIKIKFNVKNTNDNHNVKVEVSKDGINWVNEIVYELAYNEIKLVSYQNTLDSAKYIKISIAPKIISTGNAKGIVIDDLQVFGYRKPLAI